MNTKTSLGEDDWLDLFDFIECGTSFAFLGDRAGKAVQRADCLLRMHPSDSESAAAAFRGARLAIAEMARIVKCDDRAKSALTAINKSLEGSERNLRSGMRKKKGRPPTNQKEMSRQAMAVLAVKWLQLLQKNPLPGQKAREVVASFIPKGMCKLTTSRERRNIRLSTEEQLEAWEDIFARKRHQEHRRMIEATYKWIMNAISEAGRDPRDYTVQQIKDWLKNVAFITTS